MAQDRKGYRKHSLQAGLSVKIKAQWHSYLNWEYDWNRLRKKHK